VTGDLGLRRQVVHGVLQHVRHLGRLQHLEGVAVCSAHRNLSTRTSMFALVQQTFLAKKLVKSLLLISTKVLCCIGTFCRAQQKLSLLHKICRRSDKKIAFFNMLLLA
jgi:hypothetical protein